MRYFAILASCVFLSGFSVACAQGSNWGPEESEAQLDKQVYARKVAMTAAQIEWLRNEFLIERVSRLNPSERADCALSLHLLSAYASAPELSVEDNLSIQKVQNSLLVFRSAGSGTAVKSGFSNKVFKSTDYFSYGDELFEIASACEGLIEPYYKEFEATLGAAGSLK